MFKHLYPVTAALLLISPSFATVLRVSAQYSTIQAGIDASVNGDTVLVADGFYTGTGNKDLDYGGRGILLISENGPDSCIIDCENFGRGFYFHSGENPSAVLSGFTIRNGLSNFYQPVSGGAGVHCANSSSPTIEYCIFRGNSSDENGGAIYCYNNSHPVIRNCSFINNHSYYGGGIFCVETSPVIVNCVFIGNTAGENGGGVCCFYGSNSIIENCSFSENSAMFGGGVKCWNSSNPTIKNCIFNGNSADRNGGGIGCSYWCNPVIENCTIYGNSTVFGGGIAFTGESNATGANNIVRGNTAATGSQIYLEGASSFTCVYSDIQGGWPGSGNIDIDPQFVSGPQGDFYLSQTVSGQPVTSPCVEGRKSRFTHDYRRYPQR